MTAVHRDLAIEAGTTWSTAWRITLDGVPLDDTWQGRAQVRASQKADVVLYEFNVAVLDSVVQLAVSAETSTGWLWRRGVFDVEIFDDTRVVRIVEGSVLVRTEVTR